MTTTVIAIPSSQQVIELALHGHKGEVSRPLSRIRLTPYSIHFPPKYFGQIIVVYPAMSIVMLIYRLPWSSGKTRDHPSHQSQARSGNVITRMGDLCTYVCICLFCSRLPRFLLVLPVGRGE